MNNDDDNWWILIFNDDCSVVHSSRVDSFDLTILVVLLRWSTNRPTVSAAQRSTQNIWKERNNTRTIRFIFIHLSNPRERKNEIKTRYSYNRTFRLFDWHRLWTMKEEINIIEQITGVQPTLFALSRCTEILCGEIDQGRVSCRCWRSWMAKGTHRVIFSVRRWISNVNRCTSVLRRSRGSSFHFPLRLTTMK